MSTEPRLTHWRAALPIKAPPRAPEPVWGYIYGYVAFQSPKHPEPWLVAEDPDLDKTAGHGTDDPAIVADALERVRRAGLTFLAQSRLGIAAFGTYDEWDALHGEKTTFRYELVQAASGALAWVRQADVVPRDGGLKPDDVPRVGRVRDDRKGIGIDAVGFEFARTPLVGATGPAISAFHLQVPHDVSLLTGATAAHDAGANGDGVTVAVVDTGLHPHPYFASHPYEIDPSVGVIPLTDGDHDPIGHGTAVAANVLAVAPKARLRMYRAADEDGNLVAPLAAFMRAKADRPPGAPYVISCSWGGDSHGPLPHLPTGMERAMALEILDAIEQGIVVVFAAGNGGHSIEPQVPGVISAGAAHVNVKLEVRASDIGSAYTSEWQPGLTVPTICGLVGMRPRGLYILLPVAPNKEIDRESSAPKQPQDGPPQPGDDTAPSDGWALLSGTSVAAPQIAGAVAILLGERADLKHADIIALFKDSAIDIRSGWVNPNFTRLAGKADDGTDIATGLGLVDVGKALELLRSA